MNPSFKLLSTHMDHLQKLCTHGTVFTSCDLSLYSLQGCWSSLTVPLDVSVVPTILIHGVLSQCLDFSLSVWYIVRPSTHQHYSWQKKKVRLIIIIMEGQRTIMFLPLFCACAKLLVSQIAHIPLNIFNHWTYSIFTSTGSWLWYWLKMNNLTWDFTKNLKTVLCTVLPQWH